MQCEMARESFVIIKETPEAIAKYTERELRKFQNLVSERSEKTKTDTSGHWAFSKDGVETFVSGQRDYLPKKLEASENRINQNELILMMAVFESIMKDIHREVLRQKPSLLKPDRKIDLGRIISTGSSSVIEEEIEREVTSLDRKNLDEKCRYFEATLDLSWGDKFVLNSVKKSLRKRNIILHEDPDTVIDQKDNMFALLASMTIPLFCIAQGSVLYPEGFAKVKHIDDELIIATRRRNKTKG